MALTAKKRKSLDAIFTNKGYTDYKWIDPKKVIVSQWVRMKCRFGCGGYGRIAACPPHTPSVAECEQFFGEYSDAVILHFEGTMDKPEDRHAWSRKINAQLVKLEREVFLSGYERAFLLFMLFMDSCCFCKECTGDRETCKEPRMSRPSPEGMAVDVYSTVRQFEFPINVRTEYNQNMDRYAFLMVH
jgi:predicted metal-binding protein